MAKLFDIRRSSDIIGDAEYHKAYIALHNYTNFGTPAFLHDNDISIKHGFKNVYDTSLYRDPFIPPNIYGKEVVTTKSRMINDAEKVLNVTVNGNSAVVEILCKDNTRRSVKVCFCDENNYNILRIADELGNKKLITALLNGDYSYLGGGRGDRGTTIFGSSVSEINPDISYKSVKSVNENIKSVRKVWDIVKLNTLKHINSNCLSSEENMFMYTNLYDIFKFLCSDLIYTRQPTPEGISIKELTDIPAVKARAVFNGTPKFTREQYEDLVGRYPVLWYPEISKHFIDNKCLFVCNMTIFTDYKYNLLQEGRTANAIYAVGPMWFNRDYEDKKQIELFVEEYNNLIRNIMCSDFSNSEILVASIIGGRFQLLKKFSELENHSDERIRSLIKNSKTDSSASSEMFKLSNDFAENMRKNHLIECYINNLPNSSYNQVYLSVPTGEYSIFGQKLVVENCDGPNGKGTPFPKLENTD